VGASECAAAAAVSAQLQHMQEPSTAQPSHLPAGADGAQHTHEASAADAAVPGRDSCMPVVTKLPRQQAGQLAAAAAQLHAKPSTGASRTEANAADSTMCDTDVPSAQAAAALLRAAGQLVSTAMPLLPQQLLQGHSGLNEVRRTGAAFVAALDSARSFAAGVSISTDPQTGILQLLQPGLTEVLRSSISTSSGLQPAPIPAAADAEIAASRSQPTRVQIAAAASIAATPVATVAGVEPARLQQLAAAAAGVAHAGSINCAHHSGVSSTTAATAAATAVKAPQAVTGAPAAATAADGTTVLTPVADSSEDMCVSAGTAAAVSSAHQQQSVAPPHNTGEAIKQLVMDGAVQGNTNTALQPSDAPRSLGTAGPAPTAAAAQQQAGAAASEAEPAAVGEAAIETLPIGLKLRVVLQELQLEGVVVTHTKEIGSARLVVE
jgi:hypothetical protein